MMTSKSQPPSGRAQQTLRNLQQAYALHQAGQFGPAAQLYRAVLAEDRCNFDALHLFGLLEAQQGHLAEAQQLLRSAIKINGQAAAAHINLARVLNGLGHHAEALVHYDKALSIEPRDILAHNNRGNTLHELKRYGEALAAFDKAIALDPRYADALANRGIALNDLQRYSEALEAFDRALALAPQDTDTLIGRANALDGLERRQEALATLDRLLAIQPQHVMAHFNRGNVLSGLARFADATAAYAHAIAFKPDFVDAICNRANLLVKLGQFEQGLAEFARALQVDPGHGMANFKEGICRLLLGDFTRGFEKYEWRWQTEPFRSQMQKRAFASPAWRKGESIAGKTVLLHAEQGFGDTIQFCRYVPLVAAQGAKVVFETQPALKALLSGMDGAAHVVAVGDRLTAFDVHCPLASLPFLFGTRADNVPAHIPYIAAPAERVATWKQRLVSAKPFKIGLAWRGNASPDPLRSMPLEHLAPLLDMPDILFVGLQRDMPADEETMLKQMPILHLGGELADFADTAAIFEGLDLVISIDTGVAHLAGAMGKPVWICLPHYPDWRWMLDRDDTPWYPQARLYRQSQPGDWGGVISRLREELSRWISAKG
jgi:tetratricopeptide (TPR) repeat protein